MLQEKKGLLANERGRSHKLCPKFFLHETREIIEVKSFVSETYKLGNACVYIYKSVYIYVLYLNFVKLLMYYIYAL